MANHSVRLLTSGLLFGCLLVAKSTIVQHLRGQDIARVEHRPVVEPGGLPAPFRRFIRRVPKAELHVHIEGTLEPEMMLAIAARNGLPPPYPSVEAARAAYNFADLQSFLDLYYFGCSVLRTKSDFYDLAMAYFKRAAANNIVHAEVFFDPQTHISNNISWVTFMGGLEEAAEDAGEKLGISVSYIMCFRKDLSEESANATLTASLPWLRHIIAVGLDSTEAGNPPSKFVRVYEKAAKLGLLRVAHAGEEGPPEYVWQVLQLLHVRRVDHGVHSLEDPALLAHLNATRTPLTLCPISNLKLKVYDGQLESKLRELVLSGLLVTVNSDDAAYFGAYANDNYEWLAEVAALDVRQVAQLAKNSFEASFFMTADGGAVGGAGDSGGGSGAAGGAGESDRKTKWLQKKWDEVDRILEAAVAEMRMEAQVEAVAAASAGRGWA